MATPARLIRLRCPHCRKSHWNVDNDFRGMDGVPTRHENESYRCPRCEQLGVGFVVRWKAWPGLLLSRVGPLLLRTLVRPGTRFPR